MGMVISGRPSTVLRRTGGARGLLTRTELSRADALRAVDDREAFLAAHALVRICAARLLDFPEEGLTVVQSCGRCDRPHGRPRLLEAPGVTVSLSHTRGWVAAAAAHRPIGVDIETVGAGPLDWRLARLAAGAEELAALRAHPQPHRAFIRQWVRKESLVKVGAGALDDLRALDLPVGEDGPVRWSGWRLTDWAAGGDGRDCTEALGCVAARDPVRLELLDRR